MILNFDQDVDNINSYNAENLSRAQTAKIQDSLKHIGDEIKNLFNKNKPNDIPSSINDAFINKIIQIYRGGNKYLENFCLYVIDALLNKQEVATKLFREGTISFFMDQIDEFLELGTSKQETLIRILVALQTISKHSSPEIKNELVYKFRLVDKMKKIIEGNPNNFNDILKNALWVVGHLVKNSSKDIRSYVFKSGILDTVLPFFENDKTLFRILSFYPDEFNEGYGKKCEEIIDKCKQKIDPMGSDLDALIIFHNLTHSDENLGAKDLGELKRVATEIMQGQAEGETLVNINADKRPGATLMKQPPTYILVPLDHITRSPHNLINLFAPDLIRGFFVGLKNIRGINNRVITVRILNRFTKIESNKDEIIASFGRENYNTFKKVDEIFHAFVMSATRPDASAKLPPAILKVIGAYFYAMQGD